MSYTGRFSPQNPKKYKGDPTNIIYRSLWELNCMKQFDTNPNILQWASEELPIPYHDPVQRKRRRYFPDFIIVLKDKDGRIQTKVIEVKPSAQTVEPVKKKRITKQYVKEVTTWATNQAKWDAAKAFCDERGWEFQLLTENEIYGIKRKTNK